MMEPATVETILQQVAMLPPGEQARLRSLLLKNGDTLENDRQDPPIKLAVPIPEPDLQGSMSWLAVNSEQFARQWVALDGARLIAHGDSHDEVANAAEADGAYFPW